MGMARAGMPEPRIALTLEGFVRAGRLDKMSVAAVGQEVGLAFGMAGLGQILAGGGASVALKRKRIGHPDAARDAVDGDAIAAELGTGTALEGETRARLETTLGEIGEVRVHTGGRAAQIAADLGARALAVGSDIAFAEGEYKPGTAEGDALLAHEVTHVRQAQDGALGAGLTPLGSAAELQADRAADAMRAGTALVEAPVSAPGSVQLQPNTKKTLNVGAGQIQQRGNSCGTTSTAMVLRLLGYVVAQDEVDTLIRNPALVDMFTSPDSIVTLLDELGHVGKSYSHCDFSHIEQNIDNDVPMMPIIDAYGSGGENMAGVHYVVIDGYDTTGGQKKLHIVDPNSSPGTESGMNAGWFDYDAWAAAHWTDIKFPPPLPAFNNFFITVGDKGTGGVSGWVGAGGAMLLGEGAANWIDAITTFAKTFDSWDDFARSMTTGALKFIFSTIEAVVGLGAAASQLIVRLGELGWDLIQKGGAGNVTGGIFLLLFFGPLWLAKGIVDLVANLGSAIVNLVLTPFRLLIDWLEKDDRIRATIQKLGPDGLKKLNVQTMQSMIRDLLEGFCGDDDEDAILEMLDATTDPTAKAALGDVLGDKKFRTRLYGSFDGAQYYKLLKVMVVHLGTDMRIEVVKELLAGHTDGGDEAFLIDILDASGQKGDFSLSEAEIKTVFADKKLRKWLYGDVDGTNYDTLMATLFKRIPEWRGEILDRMFDGNFGSKREKLVMGFLEKLPDAEMGKLLSKSRRAALYSAFGGKNFYKVLLLLARKSGDKVRAEIFDELLDGATGDDDEGCLIKLCEKLPAAQLDAVLTPKRIKRLVEDVDGAEFTKLMKLLFKRQKRHQGWLVDVMCHYDCGDAREKLLLKVLKDLPKGEFDTLIGVKSRRKALYSAIDGAEYQQLCRLIGTKATSLDVVVEVIEELISGSCGDDDEDSILAILRASSKGKRDRIVKKVTRDELDGALQGTQQDQLDTLLDG